MCRTAKQKVNIHQKQNGKCTEVTNRIYRSLHTILHFPVLLGCLVDTHCRCCDSDCVELFNLVFHNGLELDKPPWSWRQCRHLHSSESLLVERVERLNLFLVGKIVTDCKKESFIDHIFVQSFCSSRRHFTWGIFLPAKTAVLFCFRPEWRFARAKRTAVFAG